MQRLTTKKILERGTQYIVYYPDIANTACGSIGLQ